MINGLGRNVESPVLKALLQNEQLCRTLRMCDCRIEKQWVWRAGDPEQTCTLAVYCYFILEDGTLESEEFLRTTVDQRMELRRQARAYLEAEGWSGPVYCRFRTVSDDQEDV